MQKIKQNEKVESNSQMNRLKNTILLIIARMLYIIISDFIADLSTVEIKI